MPSPEPKRLPAVEFLEAWKLAVSVERGYPLHPLTGLRLGWPRRPEQVRQPRAHCARPWTTTKPDPRAPEATSLTPNAAAWFTSPVHTAGNYDSRLFLLFAGFFFQVPVCISHRVKPPLPGGCTLPANPVSPWQPSTNNHPKLWGTDLTTPAHHVEHRLSRPRD